LVDYQEVLIDGVLTALREIWWLFALAAAIAVTRTPVVKGWIGEALVRLSARMLLKPAVYCPFHNVTLRDERGTTQIDHIFVSPYGVFVVETKTMKGWIFGGERQATWMQKIYRSSHKFQNPLRQNYRHAEAIRKLLDLDAELIHSIVVFAGDSRFKTKMPENVVQGGGYIGYIRKFRRRVFDDARVEDLCEQIANGRLAQTRATHRAHVKNLTAEHADADGPACPKCGAPTTLRKTKKGERAGQRFWGCSNFPTCRGALRYSPA